MVVVLLSVHMEGRLNTVTGKYGFSLAGLVVQELIPGKMAADDRLLPTPGIPRGGGWSLGGTPMGGGWKIEIGNRGGNM